MDNKPVPVFTFPDFEAAALLEARIAIAQAMEAQTLVCQGAVIDLQAAQDMLTYVKEKAGW